jgi:hypothetical protein
VGICGLDLSGSGQGILASSCRYGKEASGSKKGVNFLAI